MAPDTISYRLKKKKKKKEESEASWVLGYKEHLRYN